MPTYMTDVFIRKFRGPKGEEQFELTLSTDGRGVSADLERQTLKLLQKKIDEALEL